MLKVCFLLWVGLLTVCVGCDSTGTESEDSGSIGDRLDEISRVERNTFEGRNRAWHEKWDRVHGEVD